MRGLNPEEIRALAPYDIVYPGGRGAYFLAHDGDHVWAWEHGCEPRRVHVDSLHAPPDRTAEPDWLTMGRAERVRLLEPVRCGECGEPEDAWGCSEGECRAMPDERQGRMW